ncbi:MAG TPA: MetQ/NlpA family ABC transporter substrate-binding protein [Candidatus Merdenecus merdavium]|nr:MetQ/NlpA family ABC transporter substrate-binding protein [Candidatus Merdenecus merdavium]
MKRKFFVSVMAITLGISLLTGCGKEDDKKIIIGATPSPHAEILEVAKEELKKEGYELEIKEFTDYIQPNKAVDSGELDANFFQHKPYLDQYNEENNTKLVSIGAIHYEPIGIYAGKSSDLANVPDGAEIAVPNDTTNEARALLLLENEGLIKIKEGAGLNATKLDIVENPKNIEILELEAAQVPNSLKDVDFAVINGNYAIQNGLNVNEDALAFETTDSVAADTYANVLVVNEGNEDTEKSKALVKAVQSDSVRTFIEEKYDGAVVPLF